jgi:hypothetical protein
MPCGVGSKVMAVDRAAEGSDELLHLVLFGEIVLVEAVGDNREVLDLGASRKRFD